MGEYRKAEVCLNGHATTMDLQYSELTSPYCSQCGAKTIRECPSCNSSIRGNYRVEGVISMDDPVPAYCHSCGNALRDPLILSYEPSKTNPFLNKRFALDNLKGGAL